MISVIPTGGARRILLRLSSLVLCAAALLPSHIAKAAVLGADERNDAAAFLSEEQESRFAGLGRIECVQAGSRGASFNATGWIAAAADTVLTAAHTFFRQDRRGARTVIVDPRNCLFVLYNRDQSIREIANIRYAISPWADAWVRGDSSHDIAVLKLAKPVRVSSTPTISTAARVHSAAQLVAFQTGVIQDQRARITRGETRLFPILQRYEFEGARISDASRLFSTSANSSPSSSGGLYYHPGTGSVFGMHLGSVCDPSAGHLVYQRDRCFNYGLRFDRSIRALIKAVMSDMPPQQRLIAPVAPAPSAVAMVPTLVS